MRAARPRLARAAFVPVLIVASLVDRAPAQCPVPDNLDPGPCCTGTQPKHPRLPNFKQDSLSICWLDCDIEAVLPCRAQWTLTATPSAAGPCSVFSKFLRLRDGSGAVKWKGRIKLRYSRTWMETNPAGTEYQVWRYLANGDLRPTPAAGAPPCPVPPCAAFTGNKVRYTGYVDYADRCGPGGREFAWMLTHSCDSVDHAPGFPRAGVFHPDRTYTFVGPAAGFAVGPLQPVESGANTFEAMRRITRLPGTTVDTCEYDEMIQHQLTPTGQLCACGAATGLPQYVISDLFIAGACGSTVTTPGGPFLPGFLSMGIGMWSDPFTFPGLEVLRWNAGGYDYGDPCVGVVRQEVFFGVTTERGWVAETVPPPGAAPIPLPFTFVDQANSLRGPNTIMNMPFRSDHILNLNY